MTTYKIVVKFNNSGSKIHWLAVQRGLGADWRLVQCLGSRALARAALKSARRFGTTDDE